MRPVNAIKGHAEPKDHGELNHRLKLACDAVNHAVDIVACDRAKSYGPPSRNFWRAARIVSAAVGVSFTANDVVRAMIAVKIARLRETIDHRDSWTDIIGYAICGHVANTQCNELEYACAAMVRLTMAAVVACGIDDQRPGCILDAIEEVLATPDPTIDTWAEIAALAAIGSAITHGEQCRDSQKGSDWGTFVLDSAQDGVGCNHDSIRD